MKIKIFVDYHHPVELEKDVNDWLACNKVEVIEIKHSACIDQSHIYHTVTIVYKEIL